MDHPGARIGSFPKEGWAAISRRFGFYGVKRGGVAHMYQHGLTPNPRLHRGKQMLNCAAYVMGLRAPDDPWDALKRLLLRQSPNALQDTWAFISSPGFVAKGVAIKMFERGVIPKPMKDGIINLMIQLNPNFVAEEFQNGRIPHKLVGMAVDAITEQIPDPDSRIMLSPTRTDELGMPTVVADWRIHPEEMQTLATLGRLLTEELPRAGLPAPVLEEWVREGRLDQAVAIDMAHTIGTTRMSDDPRTGVVDANCRVHGVDGLYVAGSSVFPTSGHANPTLMLLSLAVRLADHLKAGPLA
jgi:choline dehydrogenase-like flavoprotein